jgi:hypothetical protein
MVALEVTKATASALLAAVVASPGFLRRRFRVPTALNHRGKRLAVALGLGLTATIELAALGMVAGDAIAGRTVRASDLWLAGGIAAVFVAGFADDLRPTRVRGLRTHVAELARGHLTTGIWKLLAAVAAAVAWAASTHTTAPRFLLGVPVIAGMANVLNLLDVAPGRALKYGIVTAIALAVTRYSSLLVIVIGGCIGVIWLDLRERGMLGDAGANVLGFVLGVALFDRLDLLGLAIALALILVVHALAETVTLSRIIDAVAPLRGFDRLGRLPMPEEPPTVANP